MDKEIRRQIVFHAVRWAGNILTEVLSNHGEYLQQETRLNLKDAIASLAEVNERNDSK